MISDLDSRITNQLALLRVLHNCGRPLLAMLREKLLNEKLLLEVQKLPPSLEVETALEAIDRWNELAEKVEHGRKPW